MSDTLCSNYFNWILRPRAFQGLKAPWRQVVMVEMHPVVTTYKVSFMAKRNFQIKLKYDLYKALLESKKKIVQAAMVLVPKESNADWLSASSAVVVEKRNETVQIFVEKQVRDKKYGIKLRCTELADEPFFRFDSDGPAHRNADPNIPLSEQVVSTPHFNAFDSEGRYVAYKSEVLKNDGDAQAIADDINFGMAHFYSETYSSTNSNEPPQVMEQNPTLGLHDDFTIPGDLFD